MKKYMNKAALSAAAIAVVTVVSVTAFSGDEHHEYGYESHEEHEGYDDHGHGHEEEHSDVVMLDDAIALKAGVVAKLATSGEIQKHIPLNGQIVLNDNQTAVLRSRLTGTVRAMHVNVGDKVSKGQKLATIYSNNSLSNYDLISPMNGTVVERANALGDVLEGDEILTVSNLDVVWARFHIFPKDAPVLQHGMDMFIEDANNEFTSQNVHLTRVYPSADIYSQSLVAVAEVSNKDGNWKPGLNVKARAYTQSRKVDLVVPQKALHVYEEQQVVFVKEGGEYKPAPVKLGIQDQFYAEIIEGLEPKQEYVAEGSYVIKAELLKSTAAHNH